MRMFWTTWVLMVGVTCGSVFGQQSSTAVSESHKYRTLLTVTGAGSGFAVGLLAGLAVFDDSVNSDRKVWTTAVLSAAGGAVGGCFLGRALDKRGKKATVTRKSVVFEDGLAGIQGNGDRTDPLMRTIQRSELRTLPVAPGADRRAAINQAYAFASTLDTNQLYLDSVAKRLKVGNHD